MKSVKPKVELVNYTQDALELLILTKGTRLHGNQTLADIKRWPMDKKLEHLAYMKDTIKSSWEFVDYTFLIQNVSRVFTHQLVRTRDQAGIEDPAYGFSDANPAVASFAQQAMRTADVRENGYVEPANIIAPEYFERTMQILFDCYSEVMELYNEHPQNARYILPGAVATSVITKLSLRTLHHMAEVRLCTRTQGEYQDVFRMMRDCVYNVHPWAIGWIEVYCVNHGICCFPRYKECPIQEYTFKSHSELRSKIYSTWERHRFEAKVLAKDGGTINA